MADVYAFLELENIKGEAQDSKFKDKIELLSCSWGATNGSSYASGTGGNIGKGQIHDISFSKFMCRASPELMKRVVSGKAIESGKLSLCKPRSGWRKSFSRRTILVPTARSFRRSRVR